MGSLNDMNKPSGVTVNTSNRSRPSRALIIISIISILLVLLRVVPSIVVKCAAEVCERTAILYVQEKYDGVVELGEVEIDRAHTDGSLATLTYSASLSKASSFGQADELTGHVYCEAPGIKQLVEGGFKVVGDDLQEQEILDDLVEEVRKEANLPKSGVKGVYAKLSKDSAPVFGQTNNAFIV